MICQSCGNNYDKTFQVKMAGRDYIFDSFECAIHLLAPRCGHCHCAVVGHGVEVDALIFCSAHCAKETGKNGVKDRAGKVNGHSK